MRKKLRTERGSEPFTDAGARRILVAAISVSAPDPPPPPPPRAALPGPPGFLTFTHCLERPER